MTTIFLIKTKKQSNSIDITNPNLNFKIKRIRYNQGDFKVNTNTHLFYFSENFQLTNYIIKFIQYRNNLQILITTSTEKYVIQTLTGGILGLKGKKKITFFSGKEITASLMNQLLEKYKVMKLKINVALIVDNITSRGRGALIGVLKELNKSFFIFNKAFCTFQVKTICYNKKEPFNGCRLPKERRK